MRARAVCLVLALGCNGSLAGGAAPDGGGPVGDAALDSYASSGEDSGIDTGSSRVPKVHRAVATPCPPGRGPGTGCPVDGGAAFCQCSSDADCTQGANGRCNPGAGGPLEYLCTYDACFSDSDCSGVPCECRASASDTSANFCASGSHCRLDSDCGPGGYCSPSFEVFCGVEGWFCHTPSDGCTDDSDCGGGHESCGFDPAAGSWACHTMCPPPP